MHLHILSVFPQILLTVKRWEVGVLVSSGYDKNTTDWGLRQQRRSRLTAPEAASPTLCHWQIWHLIGAHFLACGLRPLCPHLVEREASSLWGLFLKGH